MGLFRSILQPGLLDPLSGLSKSSLSFQGLKCFEKPLLFSEDGQSPRNPQDALALGRRLSGSGDDILVTISLISSFKYILFILL